MKRWRRRRSDTVSQWLAAVSMLESFPCRPPGHLKPITQRHDNTSQSVVGNLLRGKRPQRDLTCSLSNTNIWMIVMPLATNSHAAVRKLHKLNRISFSFHLVPAAARPQPAATEQLGLECWSPVSGMKSPPA